MKPEKQLYQWDVNQYLTGINPSAQYVDYPIGDEVIRIKADGTFRAYSFTVLYAPKPPDYVYTQEERTTFEALTVRVDAAIEEIKRRADSGEFTPVKGVDYFTDAEKNEMMESVSSGAVGEFRKVVDSATTEYNANAAEKLSTYNRNSEQKLEAYNQNATTKTAEFDANADALQTEVYRLRGECDTLAAENRKQENRIDALIKLNKGQTYDILSEDGESASITAPSGAKYVSVDKVGGKSVVWNQLWNYGDTRKEAGVTYTYDNHFYDVVKNTTASNGLYVSYNVKPNNKYYVSYEASSNDNIKLTLSLVVTLTVKLTKSNKRYRDIITTKNLTTPRSVIYIYSPSGVACSYRVGNIKVIDLSAMFGAGNEPTTEQFEAMFPAESYTYNPGEIISSRTETITAGAESITTGFPELHSAGTAHDEIDMDGGAIRRNVGTVDLGTLKWDNNGTFEDGNVQFTARVPGRAYTTNGLCDKFEKSEDNALGTYTLRTNGDQITFTAPKGTEIHAFVESMSGATLYYELATPTTEPVTIPEALQEWLPVEASGTVTFRNSDDTKQLPVPNAVSLVRKLNEVN